MKTRSSQSAVRSSSWFLRLALAGLLAAGFTASPALAATTTYDTNNTPYTGGTIDPGDIVLLNDGATVTGNITDNGTLQFNQSAGNTLTISNTLSGTGTLSLTNSGTLNLTGTSAAAETIVLDMTTIASAGLLQIRSGTGLLYVGNSGTGTLNVSGGSVTNRIGYIGYAAGGVGTVTVSSGTWANSTSLQVGYGGTGTLNVNGGSVTSPSTTISAFVNGVGSATVSSGTWVTSGNLTVGNNTAGTLTMNGGLLVVGRLLSSRAGSTINLNAGGTLQIGTGDIFGILLGGTGSLVNNGTLIFNRSSASTYSGVLSGSGAVTKQAAGLLTFAGANSYSGLTTISAGTLALSGAGSIGTGGLNLGTSGSPGAFDIAGLTAGTYSLPSSASLAGVGTISGNGKSLAVLGSLAPGNSAGAITVGSGLSLDLSNSASSVFEITDPAYTAGTYDLVSGDGSVVFGGILNLAFSGGSYANGTDVLQLFANTGGRSGNFSAVNATGLAAGQSATFNPTTGFITVVPEPSTCAMALAGLACGGYSLFRRRRAN
jgi:T5SS/PEP-CTERM-associated repeat protein/autotransporter-associated beta strand protein